MLEYRPKCRDFMASIGQESFTFRTDSFRGEEIWEIVSEWSSTREQVSRNLYDRVSSLRDKQQAKAMELVESLNATSRIR